MGIIYDTIRKTRKDEENINYYENQGLITFADFIELLGLHSDDDVKMACTYLVSEDKFLKLDVYIQDLPDDSTARLRPTYTCLKYDAYSDYDGFKFNEDFEYPTEDFLEDFLYENPTREYDSYYYWKIDDLLSLECIVRIGLDFDNFDLCYKSMYSNASLLVACHKKNRLLLDRLEKLETNEVSTLLVELEANKAKLDEKEKEVQCLLIKLKEEKQKVLEDNDQVMHPRTANNAGKIIAALTSELLQMDLTQPFSAESNGRIRAAIERQGNTLGKSAVAYWLELAHENSI